MRSHSEAVFGDMHLRFDSDLGLLPGIRESYKCLSNTHHRHVEIFKSLLKDTLSHLAYKIA